MYCSKCGAQMEEGAIQCNSCGAPRAEAIKGEPAANKGRFNSKTLIGIAAGLLVVILAVVWFGVIPAVQAKNLEAEYTKIQATVNDTQTKLEANFKEITDMSLDSTDAQLDSATNSVEKIKQTLSTVNRSSKYSRVGTKKSDKDFQIPELEATIKDVSSSINDLKAIYARSIDMDKEISQFEASSYTYGNAIDNFKKWKASNDGMKNDLLKLKTHKYLKVYKLDITNALGYRASFLSSKSNASQADLDSQVALSNMVDYTGYAKEAYNNAQNSYYLADTYAQEFNDWLKKAEDERDTYDQKVEECKQYNKEAETYWDKYAKAIGINLRSTKPSKKA